MVGREEGRGDHSKDMPGICEIPGSSGMFTQGTGVPWCCDQVLASGARPFEGHACSCFAAEALCTDELDESWRSCAILVVCTENPAPREVLHYRMVYGIAAQRDCGSQMVDDRS